ncbi:MAG TPA: hypothetical protein VK387_03850 [Thermoleophilaceae bacterium]|nr:hypothetical protein [Thermoleophilaceae bacterium]
MRVRTGFSAATAATTWRRALNRSWRGGGGTDRIYLHDEAGSAPRLSDPSGYEVQAGDAADVVDARDGERSDVDCGAGVDRLLADPGDRAVRCESRSERPR